MSNDELAQGHEDAVQVVREAEAALIQATDGDSPATWAGTPWWHVHRLLRVLTTPAPVSSPAGEDVERVALRRLHAVHAEHYNVAYPATLCTPCKEQAKILAALSARPVEGGRDE